MNTLFLEAIRLAKYKFKERYPCINPASIRVKLYLSKNSESEKIAVAIDADHSIYYDKVEFIFTSTTEKSSNKEQGFTIAASDISYDNYTEYCALIKKFYDYKEHGNDEFILGYMEEAIKLLCQRDWISQNEIIKY